MKNKSLTERKIGILKNKIEKATGKKVVFKEKVNINRIKSLINLLEKYSGKKVKFLKEETFNYDNNGGGFKQKIEGLLSTLKETIQKTKDYRGDYSYKVAKYNYTVLKNVAYQVEQLGEQASKLNNMDSGRKGKSKEQIEQERQQVHNEKNKFN